MFIALFFTLVFGKQITVIISTYVLLYLMKTLTCGEMAYRICLTQFTIHHQIIIETKSDMLSKLYFSCYVFISLANVLVS